MEKEKGRREGEGVERESCSERDLIMKPYNLYFTPTFACIHTAPSLHTPSLHTPSLHTPTLYQSMLGTCQAFHSAWVESMSLQHPERDLCGSGHSGGGRGHSGGGRGHSGSGRCHSERWEGLKCKPLVKYYKSYVSIYDY